MTTITEFLLARIEDVERALAAMSPPPTGGWRLPLTPYAVRECEAKRRIVERHDSNGWDFACEVEGGGHPRPGDCPDLRALAAVYADHPDYDEEWRP